MPICLVISVISWLYHHYITICQLHCNGCQNHNIPEQHCSQCLNHRSMMRVGSLATLDSIDSMVGYFYHWYPDVSPSIMRWGNSVRSSNWFPFLGGIYVYIYMYTTTAPFTAASIHPWKAHLSSSPSHSGWMFIQLKIAFVICQTGIPHL